MTTTVANNTMKYNLQKFKETKFYGFEFVIPEDTVTIINYLTSEIGSSAFITNPVFQKNEHLHGETMFTANKGRGRNKKNSKFSESNDEDWENLRSFHSTTIKQSSGIDGHIDNLRSNLNKLTDKTYQDIRTKIFDILDTIVNSSDFNETTWTQVSTVIFDIASTNKFFSKIYADLYSDLFLKYEFMRSVFEESFNKFIELFAVIEYINPEENYDKFCKINKDNEKRKALSVFFINLMINGIIDKSKISKLLKTLLVQISEYVVVADKKNEVDELIENVALLYRKDLIDCDSKDESLLIDELSITEFITKLANTKVQKDKSLSNKTIFKCMDLVGL